MAKPEHAQVAVIGGGPGGYAAAFMAADLGLEVTLFEPRENPGGVCLYEGCIPSKALLHVAKLINETSEAKAWGVTFDKPELSLSGIRSWKNSVVSGLTGGVGQLSKRRGVTHVRGTAAFRNDSELQVTDNDGNVAVWTFDHAVIATGSLPSKIPSFPYYSDRVWDSTRALELKSVPKSLLVVGGGYIGLELGTVYAALGSKITVVEMTPGLLPGADRDLVNPLVRSLQDRFEAIRLNTTVTAMQVQKTGVKVSFEGEDAPEESRFDRVLVAVGRRPETSSLALENTGVQVNDRGFIKVDEQRRTAQKNIFAIGDVAGEPMLAHKATYEGRVAAMAIAGKPAGFDAVAIPAVVFTDPEIAWCGLTETEAKKTGRKVKAVRFPWAASGRAATLGRADGVTKLVIDPQTERILGVGMSGPGAGELIAEGVLAVEMAAVVGDIAGSIHPHPTLSESVMEAADIFHGLSTHFYTPKRR